MVKPTPKIDSAKTPRKTKTKEEKSPKPSLM